MDALMNLFFLILTSNICSNGYLIVQNGFVIVTDRKFKRLMTKNEMYRHLIRLVDDNEGSLDSDYFLNCYFSKLFMSLIKENFFQINIHRETKFNLRITQRLSISINCRS
ncbi:hypothetical protein NBO_399g0003 [Nosema bombycis CQ1]|uniref:Uncharacterized protein n=1 Tax=Nosema bombycis (strain CQ1 / CVCC 102059) TaxID=578461 RepID=R0KQW1_NOSB1|nr:hypothetical protein NBO_399g0003 [Nosema bombycis CQ1]|eukprot:EOB12602.1 hypothetical protein NBO_399g0003 [Nosema bombycis CQ1]